MRNLFWVFAALAVVFGFASANLWRDLRAERSLAASLQTQLDDAGPTAGAMSSAPSPAMTASTTVSPAAATAAANQPAAPAERTPRAFDAPTALADYQKQQREMMKDPEYRKARLAQMRNSVAGNNRTLAEDLGLSPSEADKVLDLLAEHDLDRSAEMLLPDSSDQAAVQEMLRKQQESLRQRDEKVAALLGASRAAQWQQYQQAAPARNRVTAMNNTLIRSNQPLSAAQQKTLATALATEMQNFSEEMSALTRDVNPQDPVARAQVEQVLRNRQEDSNQRILAAAAPILSAAQLATVRAQFEQQSAMTRAMQRARERASTMQAQETP